jgi:hypothetical protein
MISAETSFLMTLIAARAISTRANVVSAMPMRFMAEEMKRKVLRLIGLPAKHPANAKVASTDTVIKG